MSKLQILMLQLLGCLILGIIMGIAFWLFDGGKTCKKVSEYPGKASNALEMAIYQGQWIEDIQKVGDYWSVGYLEVIGK